MHLPIWSCLQPLFSFWANFLHFVTMWLMVYSRSPHIPHNGDISSPSILFLILLALNAWSRAVIMRPSVSIVEMPILRQSQVSVLRSCLAALSNCPCSGYAWYSPVHFLSIFSFKFSSVDSFSAPSLAFNSCKRSLIALLDVLCNAVTFQFNAIFHTY